LAGPLITASGFEEARNVSTKMADRLVCRRIYRNGRCIGGFEFRGVSRQPHERAFGTVVGRRRAVEASSTESVDANTAESDPTTLVTLAKGLHARVLSATQTTGPNIDQMAFWPNDQNPHASDCLQRAGHE
jgi:hypothetical protein